MKYTHQSFRVVPLVDFDPADVFRQLGVVDRCVEEMSPQSDFRFLGFQRSIWIDISKVKFVVNYEEFVRLVTCWFRHGKHNGPLSRSELN